MKAIKTINCLIVLTLLAFSLSSWSATTFSSQAHSVAKEWAEIKYLGTTGNRQSAMKALYSRTEDLLIASPDDEELLTWVGIVTASYAGEVGGLKALKIVKKAKSYLERAMKINPDALHGGARTTLGALYYQVPGWPIGFGDNKKAEKLLIESAHRFPTDMNALYFLGSFLVDQKRESEAIGYLTKASIIKPREQFLTADTGLLQEINETLDKLNAKK